MTSSSSARLHFPPGRVARAATLALALGTASLAAVVWATEPPFGDLHRAPAIPPNVDDVVFEAGNWTPDLVPGTKGESWGNHRAVVDVDGAATLAPGANVRVTIPWRRHDQILPPRRSSSWTRPRISPVTNAIPLRIDNVSGDIVFQPNRGSRTYSRLLLAVADHRRVLPDGDLPGVGRHAGRGLDRGRARPGPRRLPRARTTRMQSVNAFHSFFPMEVIATDGERARFMHGATNGWRLIPEHRDYPVRMRRFLPKHWTDRGPVSAFDSRVLRDEYFTFQVAVVAGVGAVVRCPRGLRAVPGGVAEDHDVFQLRRRGRTWPAVQQDDCGEGRRGAAAVDRRDDSGRISPRAPWRAAWWCPPAPGNVRPWPCGSMSARRRHGIMASMSPS